MDISEVKLEVHYDGEGELIQQHKMKARNVSKSIQALETLYLEAYKELNNVLQANIDSEVYVDGTFKEGSLWWIIEVLQKQTEAQSQLGKTPDFSIVSRAIYRVIEVLKRISPESSEILISETPDGYTLEVDNEKVVLDEVECAILTNEKIRSAISDLAKPLEEEGVDSFSILNGNTPQNDIMVTNDNKKNLLIKRKHKHIIDQGKIEGLFFIETLSYNPKSKWKLISANDSSFSFSANIEDPVFLQSISENEESFSKDDILKISGTWYKEKAKLTGKIKTVYTILSVDEHVPVNTKQGRMI